MAKYLAQIITNGIQIVGRAFARAVQNEIRASQQAAKARAGSSSNSQKSTNNITGMSLQEAKQILNITDHTDKEKLTQNYDHLFKVNDKSIGGSLYIQSKVVRAKERIEEELSSAKSDDKDDKTKKKSQDST